MGNSTYKFFMGAYAVLVLSILLFKIPSALEREADAFKVHFMLRKSRLTIKNIEEIRVVRKWMMSDSVKLVAEAAPKLCGPCLGHSYEQVGAPKEQAKRCFPFSLCEPFFCCDRRTKYFWG